MDGAGNANDVFRVCGACAPSNELHLDSARSILFRLVTRSIDRSIARSRATFNKREPRSRQNHSVLSKRKVRDARSTLVRDVRDDEISRYRRASIPRLPR
jgi:hypothetical protein